MDSSIYLATIFVFGIETTLILLFFSSFIYAIFDRKIALWKHIFNFSMYGIMISGAHYVFLLSGGNIGVFNLESLVPYIMALVSYYTINLLLIGCFFSLNLSEKLLPIIKEIGRESILNYLISLVLAFILAILLGEHPVFGVIIYTFVIVLLSVAFKKHFNLYEEMSQDRIYRQQILDSLPVGIITVDNEASNYSLNTAAMSLLNMESNDIKERIHVFGERSNQQFWDILKSKEICQNVKIRYQKEETCHHLLVSQSELLDQEKALIGRIFYFIDITDTYELEKRMHHSEKLAVLGELAAGAAHEIRNPLTVIHGFLSLMKQSFTESDKNKYQIPLLLKEFDRINSIIEEMLLMVKPGAPIIQKVFLEDIIAEIPFNNEHASVHKGIILKVELERVPLMLDPKQMKQVLYNLIRNSSEAMNGKGTISIFSKQYKNNYQIFIKDTGSGIHPEIKSTIFNPFSTSKETGTGLGLTIVQRIIENHDGKIEVFESTDAGTTFVITLPLPKNN
ncbi:two-component system sensor histidine kinase NtrB [Sutcliffiella halmapala]|uniref:two-component system sensor histidine kinase NtrB n=1 Tax=Sutcliffiella halmapala TaxID=79882 RepID=UPI001475C12A|nr:ATP-binding protein [Sutcliffiella halmapala]